MRKKKVAKKEPSVEKEGVKMPLSRFVCQMLIDNIPDAEIIQAMEQDYPDKDCSQKTVSWYRFAINKGRMEKLGFSAPEGGLINPRSVISAKKKADKATKKLEKDMKVEMKKPSAKKSAKKVARRKK